VSARQKRRGVPPEIDDLLQRALSADPHGRPSLDEFEAALAPFARVLPKDVKEPRFAMAEFRWLVPVVIVVVLAILAITVGVEVAKNLGSKKAPKASSSATASLNAIDIKDARDFDPPPAGNGEENHAQVPNAYDGDAASAWSTRDYKTADVGGKKGVGLLFDLGSVVSIGRLQLQTSLPGWGAQIRVSDQDGRTAEDFQQVISITAGSGVQTVMLPPGTKARFILVWITTLTQNHTDPTYPYSATINEIRFFAA
jgi:hypothetical protein